jgi:hypothetical protein
MLAEPEFENIRWPRRTRAAWNGTIVAEAFPQTTTSSEANCSKSRSMK